MLQLTYNIIMAVAFPLYDELLTAAEAFKGNIDPSLLSGMVNADSMDTQKGEIVMALIYHHAVINKQYDQGKTPYAGKAFGGAGGVNYVIAKLPETLKKIIWIYVNGDKVET